MADEEPVDGSDETSEQVESTANPEVCRAQKPEDLLEKLAHDYSKYFNVDVSDEKSKFSDSIEEMLTKLDEFRGLIDMVRSDTSLCLYRTLPEIQTKCTEMETIFRKIDQLERFVAMVKENMNQVEECVNKAEEEMGTFSGIRKILSTVTPFRSSKKPPNQNRQSKINFESPEIFETDLFFPSHTTISVLKVNEQGQEIKD